MRKLLFPALLLAALATTAQPARRPGRTAAKPAAPAAQGPYFQQEVNYSIDVALNDATHELTGREELTYVNHAPQALTFIWFHLWPNAYRDNTTAFARQQLRDGKRQFQFAPAQDRGFINGLDFRVNGQPAKLEFDPQNPDVAKLLLPAPLAPEASCTIATPFHVKIPASFSRLGHVGQSYQITQWYPKPAVLDRRGWHPMPYLDQGEFYSEFGSFDVRLTLPANYTVGATGELQNPDEQARLDGLAAADAGKKTAADFGLGTPAARAAALAFPPSAPATKTLRYKQDRVHDFAWFADKRFRVLKSGVTLPSGRAVASYVLFTNKEPEKWVKGLQDVNAALTYYSRWVGEYPYASATAVDGALSAGGGMEYPMVTVTMPEAIVHEVGHNWFYGILGSNERDFPWLDEGVNTSVETRVAATDSLKAGDLLGVPLSAKARRRLGLDGLPTAAFDQLPYQALASRQLDQPVQGPASADFTLPNYGLVVYGKAAALLRYLAGYLGPDKYDAAMRAYYAQWQFRHPYPEDMQAAFEASTGQKLGWFFQGMLTGTQRFDADLSASAVFPDVVKVLVRTDAPLPWAVPVSSVDAQGKILETLWTPPFGNTDPEAEEDATSQLNFRRAGVAALVVDAQYLTPQLNRRNDVLRLERSAAAGRLAATGLRLRPLASVERWDHPTISWVPVLGANTTDKFMLGAAFYNSPLVPKRVQYLAMPLFSFSRGQLNGVGQVRLNVLPERLGRTFALAATVQRFEQYLKIEPRLTLTLPHRVGAGPRHELTLANTSVEIRNLGYSHDIQALEYTGRGGNALHGWAAGLGLNRFVSSLVDPAATQPLLLRGEASYYRYYAPRRRVQLRLFGARFVQPNRNAEFVIGLSGSPDYRRETAFLDRQQIARALAAQTRQTDERDGAFGSYLPVFSQSWLSTLNLRADLPLPRVGLFADAGLSGDRVALPGRDGAPIRAFYDAGLTVALIPELLVVYLPLAGTHFGDGVPNTGGDFSSNIRFALRLDRLNPFKLLEGQLGR